MLNLLPGPVDPARGTREAMFATAESHRSPRFLSDLVAARTFIRTLARAAHADLLLGSGTLANDVIAAQLSLESSAGVILSNGEFGDRLIDHARRFKLRFDTLQWEWGRPFDRTAIERRLAQPPGPAWLWCVHLETSTGMLNDSRWLTALCRSRAVRLCLDAVSSLGTVPVDLGDVYLASSVSGKGLRAFPGLSIVTRDHAVHSSPLLPRYLDLGLYAQANEVPFTHSSNLVGALRCAIEGVDWARRYADIHDTSAWLRGRLRAMGFLLVSDEAHASPGVVTLALPPALPSDRVSAALERRGCLLAAHSSYLRQRNWIQVSLMGQPSRADLKMLIEALLHTCPSVATQPQ